MRSIDQSTEDLDKCNKNGKFDSQGQLQEIVAGLLTLVPIYLKIRLSTRLEAPANLKEP